MNIPEAAIAAATDDLYNHSNLGRDTCRFYAKHAVRAALPLLLPGLYVVPEGKGTLAAASIWVEGTPAHPGRPECVLIRTPLTATVFDALAALLPERSEEE